MVNRYFGVVNRFVLLGVCISMEPELDFVDPVREPEKRHVHALDYANEFLSAVR